jgi:hypothetical protein
VTGDFDYNAFNWLRATVEPASLGGRSTVGKNGRAATGRF